MFRPIRFRWSQILLLLLSVALLSQQGCVHRKKYSLSSMWMDYNTLRAPAIFFEKREHLPYKANQVALFHWQYGVTPGRNVKYVRPDLVGGDMIAASPYDTVMNVNAEGEPYPANIQPIPVGAANSSMSIDTPQGTMLPQKPQPTKAPIKKNARFTIETIPPPPAPPVP
ncbi:hypothetical protein [Gimesia algae]|uniref:Uncharacterized protein n=1 Tax=Gimesia algae TaxID=2527971 RepID=A0A517VI29_9PLAN|nr:hypothetical protein [Gimesia algae]QDT92674.1 hypothetical protein Pan161_43430 [Gimesia algae]